VDGLGFYYMPNSVAVRPRAVAKTTMVWVVEGEMNALHVKAEMERLVPTKMTRVVEEIEDNKFKTVFPSKGEMQQMIEWGLVQIKDRKAMLIIEELGGGSNVKQVMRKVWVQMTKLPNELRDFLTILAIGTILGATMDTDMTFTRHYNRPRMQVLVLDPALIPTSVDVVIGDNVIELHFKVEPEDMLETPKPLKMDENSDDIDGKDDENGDEKCDLMQEDTEHNSKGKNADQWFTTKPMDQQGVTIISPTDIRHLIVRMRWKITYILKAMWMGRWMKWVLRFSLMMSCQMHMRMMLLFVIQQARGRWCRGSWLQYQKLILHRARARGGLILLRSTPWTRPSR
jgi:hypothetical protein